MGKLNIRRRKSRSPQIGDLRTKITINKRTITEPNFGQASHTESHTLIASPWASIETLRGTEEFSGVDSDDNPSHLFIIRFRNDIHRDNIITLNSKNYKILSTDNADERNRFHFLPCELLGDSVNSSNQ
jgi:SPP1 family predicted phage head-tail adaptor